MTTTPTLTEFLLARIAEDETDSDDSHRAGCLRFAEDEDGIGWWCDCGHPARVLAECEAKRQIVEWCGERERVWVGAFEDDPTNPRPENFVPGSLKRLADGVVLRYLAAVYADHPDYRDEWKP